MLIEEEKRSKQDILGSKLKALDYDKLGSTKPPTNLVA